MRESRDISLRGIMAGLAIIVAGIAVSLAVGFLLVRFAQVPAAGASRAERPPAPPAALETVPHRDLEAFLREKRERLNSTGWVDREAGRMHIPIDEAMRMLAAGKQK